MSYDVNVTFTLTIRDDKQYSHVYSQMSTEVRCLAHNVGSIQIPDILITSSEGIASTIDDRVEIEAKLRVSDYSDEYGYDSIVSDSVKIEGQGTTIYEFGPLIRTFVNVTIAQVEYTITMLEAERGDE